MNGMRIRQAMCWRPVVLNPQCVLISEPSRGCLNIRGLHTGDSDLVGLVWGMMSGISINSKFPGDLSSWLRKSPFEKDCCRQISMPQAQALIWQKYWKIRLSREIHPRSIKSKYAVNSLYFPYW